MQNQVMSGKEYEDFVSYITNLTEDQKWVAIRTLPAEMLWQDLYSRFGDMQKKVDAINSIARV